MTRRKGGGAKYSHTTLPWHTRRRLFRHLVMGSLSLSFTHPPTPRHPCRSPCFLALTLSLYRFIAARERESERESRSGCARRDVLSHSLSLRRPCVREASDRRKAHPSRVDSHEESHEFPRISLFPLMLSRVLGFEACEGERKTLLSRCNASSLSLSLVADERRRGKESARHVHRHQRGRCGLSSRELGMCNILSYPVGTSSSHAGDCKITPHTLACRRCYRCCFCS